MYRLKAGLSQIKLAAKLGIDPSALWKWEKGRHKPSALHFQLLVQFFGGPM
jgi:transcriptional regulator with XRE-family HTH domain